MAASDTNAVFISGRLTADPVSRGNGKVAAFSLASNRFFRTNGDDTTKEEVVFIDCTAFGYEAEAALNKLAKGSPVMVEGRLELNRWQNDAGENRQAIRLIANRITGPSMKGGNGEKVAETTTEATEAPVADPTSDPIPF